MSSVARVYARVLVVVAAAAAWSGIASAQIDVVTERYDDARQGANLQETVLDTSNVNVDQFGKLWSYTVSGSIYAQPLYVRNVTLPGQGTHNLLYVVTMNDMLYAFDADSSSNTPLLSFDVTSEVPGSTVGTVADIIGFNDNIIGNIGIESTPVIDLSTNTMYFLARTEEPDGQCGAVHPTFCQRLHAVDITTFAERPNSPVIISGAVACNPSAGGSACGDQAPGMVTFDPKISDQRSSLALSNGRVFIAWSSHSDYFPYHGWVMAYDATTLQQTMIWSAAPDGTSFNGAGVWMGGRAPAIDADGNVYYTTGNGNWDGVTNFGESFVKFGPTPDSPLVDWFTPDSYDTLNQEDLDLAGSGPILLPGTNLIISGGKGGEFYLVNTTNMGHEVLHDVQIPQEFNNNRSGSNQIKGGPVYWNRDTGIGPWMYVWSDDGNTFNAYHFNGATFDLPAVSQGTMLSESSAGGVLTLSANGSTPGSGIVWSSMATEGANSGVHPGILRAFDADNLNTELWNSNQNQTRDDSGNWPKFSPPTVVNGHVYLGSFPSDGVGDTAVNVYGLLTPPDFTLSTSSSNPGVVPGASATYDFDVAPISGFDGTIHFDVSGLPPDATANFSANDITPPAETTLTVSTSETTPLGQYLLTITADGDATQHSVTVGLYVTQAAPGSGAIDVNFVGSEGSLLSTDVAGVAARPNWNDAPNSSGAGLVLLDESGVDTGATLDWNADGVGELSIPPDSPDSIMMNGYVDATTATTITVSNLPADPGGYFVYVYADGFNSAETRAGDYTLAGNDGVSTTLRIVDSPNTNFDGSFVRSEGGPGNYAVFFTGGTGFTLTATPNEGGHAPVNGVQIVHGDRIFGNGFDP